MSLTSQSESTRSERRRSTRARRGGEPGGSGANRGKPDKGQRGRHAMGHDQAEKKQRGWLYVAGGALAVVAAGAIGFLLARPSITVSAAPGSLGRVRLSGVGGRLGAITLAYDGHSVAATARNDRLVPLTQLPAGATVQVTADLEEPGWARWLLGRVAHAGITVVTPRTYPLESAVTIRPGQPVYVSFSHPVTELSLAPVSSSGQAGKPQLTTLAHPSSEVAIMSSIQAGQVGQVEVAASPEKWEALPAPRVVTYFGGNPGTTMAFLGQSGNPASPTVSLGQPLKILFSQPVASLFGSKMPSLTSAISGVPNPTGNWKATGPDSLTFTPTAPDFWPNQKFTLTFPKAISLVSPGYPAAEASQTETIYTTPGSTLALQEMLAQLNYLPLSWTPASPAAYSTSTSALAASVTDPPDGSFAWRWSMPSDFTSLWQEGSESVMTEGAIMTFEQVNGLATSNNIYNPLLWPTLVKALATRQVDPHPYTWIEVSESLPESMKFYQNGSITLTTLANTGVPAAPTATGTYPVYLRLPFQIMQGTNPDGSQYSDPVHWINYFNGGDAVHGFVRASYGFPQSVGCVELPVPTAQRLYPMVHIGTLVTVLPS